MEILRTRADLSYMRENASLAKTLFFTLCYKKAPYSLGYSKVAFLVSKKNVRLAVHRNRCRRLMREAYRLLKKKIALDYFFLLIGCKNILSSSMCEVKESLEGALESSGLLV